MAPRTTAGLEPARVGVAGCAIRPRVVCGTAAVGLMIKRGRMTNLADTVIGAVLIVEYAACRKNDGFCFATRQRVFGNQTGRNQAEVGAGFSVMVVTVLAGGFIHGRGLVLAPRMDSDALGHRFPVVGCRGAIVMTGEAKRIVLAEIREREGSRSSVREVAQ